MKRYLDSDNYSGRCRYSRSLAKIRSDLLQLDQSQTELP